MDPSDPVTRYLPPLGRARAEGLALPPGAPAEERRVAALVVLASIVRREGWTEVVDLSREDALEIAPGEPPFPDAFEARAHRRLVEHLGPWPCTACAGASAPASPRATWSSSPILPARSRPSRARARASSAARRCSDSTRGVEGALARAIERNRCVHPDITPRVARPRAVSAS
ncbi:hypothetical protein [Sorangium sp. So ce204]|uniref:hypothetical protein n=1 Tax=Sorangium sp. So ce204 TaxID=3133288 RepID=UPI003F5E6602